MVGFCRVPASDRIRLHPDAGLRRSRRAGTASELEPVLLMDLFGRHHLRWQHEQSARIERPWDYLLAVSYPQANARVRWALDPRLHCNGCTLALVAMGA